MKENRNKAVGIWLWIGVIMIFIQIVLGGITRLTGSGLSITRWEIVTGTIPPLNETRWNEEFDLYKRTPQFRKINTDITLSDFKFIYFWEYMHRLWARLIGIVFIGPFVLFMFKGWLTRKVYGDLGIAVLLGAVVAAFGWIMVASGLVDRPWVSAYKLTIHLGLALVLYSWMVWIAFGQREKYKSSGIKSILKLLTLLMSIQLLLGGLMSGMKAALYYPTWPDMYGEFFPKVLIDRNIWSMDSFINYETGPLPGVIQFGHRIFAYLIVVFVLMFLWRSRKKEIPEKIKILNLGLGILVFLQVTLGILTLINSSGSIPLTYGVMHQIGAIFLLTYIIILHRIISN